MQAEPTLIVDSTDNSHSPIVYVHVYQFCLCLCLYPSILFMFMSIVSFLHLTMAFFCAFYYIYIIICIIAL